MTMEGCRFCPGRRVTKYIGNLGVLNVLIILLQLNSCRGDVNLMQSQLTKLWEAVTPNHKGITTLTFSAEENIQHLCTFSQEQVQLHKLQCIYSQFAYSPAQVLLLLATLKLEQYCEIFAAERIDGKMLAEMDEDVLKEDLGVASKLHRIRLLIVINGQQRAETNLQHEHANINSIFKWI